MIRADDHDFEEARYWLDELYGKTREDSDAGYFYKLLCEFLREVEDDVAL